MPLNRRRSGDPRQAAVAPASQLRSKLRSGLGSGAQSWQRKVIAYDRNGPSVLGYYLDTVSLLASLCPLVPEVQGKGGVWTRSDDPALIATLAGFQSQMFSQSELLSLPVRHLDAVGESWLLYSVDVGWCVATVPNVVAQPGGVVEFTDPFGTKRRVPPDRAWKLWVQDPYEPWLPRSACQRALPDLRRLNAATRNQTRTAESRLVMNGMIAFPPDDGPTRALGTTAQSTDDTPPEGVERTVEDFIALGREAFDDDDSPAAVIPFPYVGGKAEYVQLGRSIDEGVIEVEKAALEAFARGVNFPAQLLTVGPGAANHWNEWLLQESQHKMGLAPKLLPVCEAITAVYYRPTLRKMRERIASWDVDPEKVRVGFDMSFLTQKPDQSSQALAGWMQGVLSLEGVAELLKVPKSSLMVIPDGMTEYEHWELASGSKGAPYAEVGPDGALIVPPPAFADGSDASGLPVVDPGDDTEYWGDPEDEQSLDDIGAPADTDSRELPEPPAQLAAASPPVDPRQAAVAALIGKLAGVDRVLVAELHGLVVAVQTAVAVEVAKEVLKALPRDSDLRAQLRDADPVEVWAKVPADVRATVDVRAVANRVVARYQPVVEDAYADAVAAGSDAFDAAGWTAPQWLAAIAVTVLGVALVDSLTDRFAKIGEMPVEMLAMGRRHRRRSLGDAMSLVRRSTVAAAGARVDAEYRLVQGPDGGPEPVAGGAWQGGTGMGLGDLSVRRFRGPLPQPGTPTVEVPSGGSSVAAALDAASVVEWTWMHGFYGEPADPFEPHELLDGMRFASPVDVPSGWFPRDHHGCRCELVPEVRFR